MLGQTGDRHEEGAQHQAQPAVESLLRHVQRDGTFCPLPNPQLRLG